MFKKPVGEGHHIKWRFFAKTKRIKWLGQRVGTGDQRTEIESLGNEFIELEIKVIDWLAHLLEDL